MPASDGVRSLTTLKLTVACRTAPPWSPGAKYTSKVIVEPGAAPGDTVNATVPTVVALFGRLLTVQYQSGAVAPPIALLPWNPWLELLPAVNALTPAGTHAPAQ